uniref:General secretion pathway protein DN3 n=1 Tax=Malawimonas jakobiformis TaxID=136089 RepID=A0A895KQU8_MALJA|nr:general secretion pathway protein DN3 [Malawimonas jakobiformis]
MDRPARRDNTDGSRSEHPQGRVSFRQPAPTFITPIQLKEGHGRRSEVPATDLPSAPSSAPLPPLPPVETQQSEGPEERQMFFYYPKYLDPDAVVLISRTLLQQWEASESARKESNDGDAGKQ